MARNELVLGIPRLGTIFDGDPGTPETRATIELTERGVKVSIIWSSDGTSVYARWFRSRHSFFALEDESMIPDEAYKIPSRLNFYDSAGAVQLIGCRSVGWRQNGNGFGEGTAFARYAILGAPDVHDYQKIHALSSEVAGLRAWLNVSSIHQKRNCAPEKKTIAVNLRTPESILLPRRDHLSLVPGWEIGGDDSSDVLRLENRLTVQTRYEEPMTWDDHLIDHGRIRDLLNISLWENHELKVSAVRNEDHGEDDGRGGKKVLWKKVRAGSQNSVMEGDVWRHLIRFSDIGPEGLSQWMDLSEEFKRAINPALTMHRLKAADAEVQLAQIGICLEALGYLIFMHDDGLSVNGADKNYSQRFARIGKDIESVAPFDINDWVKGTVEAYNGVKHANKVLPDFLEMANRVRESCLAFRIWVALRLGVDAGKLKERVDLDPQAHPYELA